MTTVIEFYIPENERKNTIKNLSKYIDNKYCKIIEKGCFDFTKQYCKSNQKNMVLAIPIYKDNVKNLLFNLEQNHETIKKIKDKIEKGEYNAYNLAFLRPDELDEDLWMRIILRKNTTEEKLNNLPTINWRKCRTCGNREYFFYQLQTRSADEPMTIFYICKGCTKTYRVNN